MKNLNLIDKFLFLVNSVIALLTLISYLNPYISPELFWPLSLVGLMFPYLIALNILFTTYWTFKLKPHLILSIISISIGYKQVKTLLPLNNDSNTKTDNSIKVMSYNVRLFDVYNWSNNKQTKDSILNFLEKEGPDIACFQEFYYAQGIKGFNIKNKIGQKLAAKNKHIETIKYLENGHQYFSIATYSKYKILNKGKITFKNNKSNLCIYTDILFKKDTIRIYNAHLASIHLGYDDYNFIDSVVVKDSKTQIKGLKNITKQLKKAFIKRAPQAEEIQNHIRKSPYPVILCVDMNDTPNSYSYTTIKNNLKDAFNYKGKGIGNTYNGRFPGVRIDYIFYSDDFNCSNLETISVPYSDHYPISAKLHKN